LEVKINDLSQSEQEIEIVLQYDEIKPDIEKEVKKQVGTIQLPGFRKGKAPLSMIKKMYGDSLEHQAAEKVANTWFWNVSKEKDLKFIGQPALTDLHFHPNEELHFKVKIEIIPELSPIDYSAQNIEIPELVAKDSDVQHELDHMLQHHKSLEPADSVLDKNYSIKAELTRVNDDDSPFEGSVTETIDIDLSNEGVHKSIIDNTLNKQVGDAFDFTFFHPEDAEEGTAQEKYHYKGIIKEIKQIKFPELNDDFIKQATKDKVSSVEEFKEKTLKDIQNYYDQRLDQITKNLLIDSIIKKNDFPPPATMVNNLLDDLVKREEEEAKKNKKMGFDKIETRNRLEAVAANQVKWYLLRNAIAKIENIAVTDDDIRAKAEKDAERIGIDVDKLFEYYKQAGLADELLEEKVFEYLRSNNNIIKIEPDKFSKKEPHSHE
jgi:trigger factor